MEQRLLLLQKVVFVLYPLADLPFYRHQQPNCLPGYTIYLQVNTTCVQWRPARLPVLQEYYRPTCIPPQPLQHCYRQNCNNTMGASMVCPILPGRNLMNSCMAITGNVG